MLALRERGKFILCGLLGPEGFVGRNEYQWI